ncbi:hypothetical protein Q8F55_001811 [Vanrija albida]|uniref:Zn(2)-C6 fungal-type domain-containing protein n=1 Tax=Vanrija albida TaxID=181172 RepID=A0ABR3Q938_9TREE
MTTHTTPSSTGGDASSSTPGVGAGGGGGGADRQPSSSKRPSRRIKYTRSKSGCLTCRKRRKQCDMAKPKCQACVRLQLACSWPPSDERAPAPPAPPPRPAHHGHNEQTVGDLMDILGWDGSNPVSLGRPPMPPLPAISPLGPPPIPQPDMVYDGFFSGLDQSLADMLNLDGATLQLWAADCLRQAGPAPLDLLSGWVDQALAPPQGYPADEGRGGGAGADRERVSSANRSPSEHAEAKHSALLHYFQSTLSRLVSCSGDGPNAFLSFQQLADRDGAGGKGSPATRALYLSILSWAGRHMANSGHAKYEAVSERLGAQAGSMLLPLLETDERGDTGVEKPEHMTLLAAAIMVVQFKICRGDVWGMDTLVDHLTRLSSLLYRAETMDKIPPDSMRYQFFENLFYHDILGSFLYTSRGPMLPHQLLSICSQNPLQAPNTLTGMNVPIITKMYRIAELIRRRRSAPDGILGDAALSDVVDEAEQLESELQDEKRRLDALVKAKPEMHMSRYLHEAFRTASLIQLRAFALGEPPCSLRLRLLVRQSLSLLEEMTDPSIVGMCNAHWTLFMTALCAVPPGQAGHSPADGSDDDRQRADKLYEMMGRTFGFLNVPRSRKLVHEVWKRNQDGKVFVDWLDIVAEWDWEIYLV